MVTCMAFREFWLTAVVALASTMPVRAADEVAQVRVGMIGLDTSHVTTFTRIINDPQAAGPLARIEIVAAFPAGNADFPLSRDRVRGFTNEMRAAGVEIVDSIELLLAKVDAVMLESVDGSQHLAQARPVFAAGKPLFIDKPLAASLSDAVAIVELGEQTKTPWFTASASRFTGGYRSLRSDASLGDILGCDVYSQSRAAPHHPDLFWYGVHGVDLLYSFMGFGCETVSATQTPFTESVRGIWQNGRVGTYRSIREHTGKTGLGATVFGTQQIAHCNDYYDYHALCHTIAQFFLDRKPPVAAAEMLEVFAFMEAAEQSRQQGGAPVSVAAVLEAARKANRDLK